MRAVAVAWLGTAEVDVVHGREVGPEVGHLSLAAPPGGEGQRWGGSSAGALVGGVRGGHPSHANRGPREDYGAKLWGENLVE